MKLSKISLVLLAVQLALVSSIAAKYLYQRWRCPRVWTQAVAYDPELVMRGRYLSLQLIVDGCPSTLPSGKQATFERTINGEVTGARYAIGADRPVQFPATLEVHGNKLVAIRVPATESRAKGLLVTALHGSSCEVMRVDSPVNFYIAEHAVNPLQVKIGDELWIEVTVPPKGPPRPIQLALKESGVWRPLAFQ